MAKRYESNVASLEKLREQHGLSRKSVECASALSVPYFLLPPRIPFHAMTLVLGCVAVELKDSKNDEVNLSDSEHKEVKRIEGEFKQGLNLANTLSSAIKRDVRPALCCNISVHLSDYLCL